ncbi:glucose-1-phosphate thymidylyltransferase [Paenibacillus anaericanus]|uniref:Glucose-1-phosphate thymidylyltransferase n=1 Tax=Paenibacillus anaericanus TaxID=170367 RepID=A0A3S1CC05_9BACL|nr:glucose-1-phosphate thymidylyltransferase [Paenibacillus anaericanus]RUT48740.1 glucose-1-phosphate thymidylyltransferase [Paenibacillus anaericanus]
MKGLILCAGKGTRLQPFSYTQPKSMIPVVNKPVLEYCIESLTKQGINEIGIAINQSQQVIIDQVGNGQKYGANVKYIYQTEQKGIAHAVKQAEQFLDGEPFILLLGDNLIAEDLKVLIDTYNINNSHGSMMLASVPNPQDYGVVEIQKEQIISLVEKPKNPKSNLAIIGVYLLDSSIFEAINNIQMSPRGEYEITDAIQWLIDQGKSISYTITNSLFSDVGTVDRWLEANEWMMNQKWNNQIKVGKPTILENCIIKGPVIIGDNCTIINAEIGPYVCIGNDCRIENCEMDNSILLEKVIIKNLKYPVSKSVFGREVYINGDDQNMITNLNFVLGDKSKINSGN